MLTDKQTAGLGVAAKVQKAFSGEAVVLPPIEYVVNNTLDDIGLEHIRGQSPWIQCHLYPVKNSSGEITNVVNTYMDITEQKQAERDLKEYQKRLRALALELTMTEERERRRIATELHDGAAQSLAFARMQLASLGKVIAEAETANKLDDVSQILRESLGQIHEVLLDLSSPSMNEIGLGEAISEWLEEQIGKCHGLKTSFTDQCGKVPFDDDVRAVLFRNTRELLTNVVKHAQAKTVAVRIASTGDALRITIEDDGAGLNPDNAAGTSGGGFGLFSIREGMLDLGGSLEIVSARGEGCKATLVMPLDRGEEKN
jgi:signal transduction histidine kinase